MKVRSTSFFLYTPFVSRRLVFFEELHSLSIQSSLSISCWLDSEDCLSGSEDRLSFPAASSVV